MIGPIIKDKRILRGLTQKELAEGICSSKHIYLIETKQRNPSVVLLKKLSEKLKVDLFKYYRYLDFKNPSIILDFRKKIEQYIKLSDIERMKIMADDAAELSMFQSKPLIYDITFINLLYEGLIEGNRREAIDELNYIFSNQDLQIDLVPLVNGKVTLSILYQLEGELDKAQEILYTTYESIKNKVDYDRYHITYINVLISLNGLFYNDNNYKKLIKYSKKLLSFQEKNHEYNRIYYAEFYLAYAYFQKNKLRQSKKHFIRSLQFISLARNEIDLKFIKDMPAYSKMIDHFSFDQEKVSDFLKY